VLQVSPAYSRVVRLLGARTDERPWSTGGAGASEVTARLAQLPLDWHVLHAVPIGDLGADIDHLAIGPAGVFAIEAKHSADGRLRVRGDSVTVDGQHRPFVRDSRVKATRAGRLLSAAAGCEVAVHGVIAVVGARKGIPAKQRPVDVAVLAAKQLTQYLRERPAVLELSSIERIFAAARHSSTWRA
jgi:Nuclease-related domain